MAARGVGRRRRRRRGRGSGAREREQRRLVEMVAVEVGDRRWGLLVAAATATPGGAEVGEVRLRDGRIRLDDDRRRWVHP